ncbi:MAG: hypothetical protein AB1689_18115 [Thermodesulfobacteriota bacterium]
MGLSRGWWVALVPFLLGINTCKSSLGAPGSLVASTLSGTSIRLTWVDNSTKEVGFSIERSLSPTGGFVAIATKPSNTTSHDDTGLAPATTYYYRARAVGQESYSAYSQVASAQTAADATAPAVPTGVTATATSCSRIAIAWNSSIDSGGSGLKAYDVLRDGVFWRRVTAPATSTEDTGCAPSTSYAYTVKAVDGAGNVSAASQAAAATTPPCATPTPTPTPTPAADVTAPSAPGSVAASATTCTQVEVTWSAASDDAGGSGIAGYQVYRDDAALAGGWVAAPGTRFTDTTASEGRAYRYAVRARDRAGNVSASSNVAFANTPTCTAASPWSRRLGGVGYDAVRGVAVDAAGNVIVVGSFQGAVDLGGGALTSAGEDDMFVAKYSAAGAHLWSKRLGGGGYDVAYGVAVDGSGAIVLAGAFGGAVDFGGGALTSAGGTDVVVAKYSPMGVVQWAKRFGAAADDAAYAVAVDGNDDVVLTGFFQGTVSFGGTALASVYGGLDAFVVKLTGGAGAHVWSKNFACGSPDLGYGIAVDAAGDVAVTGAFRGTMNLGGGVLTSAGLYDGFVVKLTAQGAHLWSKRFGGTASDFGNGVAADDAGAVIVTGSYAGTVDFGGGALASANGGVDAFLVKYSASGGHAWSKRFGHTATDIGYAVTVDASGNATAVGYFQATADFGGGALTSAGSEDAFVASYGPSGAHRWSKRFGGTSLDLLQGVAANADGSVAVGGLFAGVSSFGTGTLTSAGQADGVVASRVP